MSKSKDRRSFLKSIFSTVGISAIPASAAIPQITEHIFNQPVVVEFITSFPQPMTLQEYRSWKKQFENKDKVTTLVTLFRKNQKMIAEKATFHGTHSVWRVEFRSSADYKEWMTLTEELESHSDEAREMAGFKLEVRVLS